MPFTNLAVPVGVALSMRPMLRAICIASGRKPDEALSVFPLDTPSLNTFLAWKGRFCGFVGGIFGPFPTPGDYVDWLASIDEYGKGSFVSGHLSTIQEIGFQKYVEKIKPAVDRWKN